MLCLDGFKIAILLGCWNVQMSFNTAPDMEVNWVISRSK